MVGECGALLMMRRKGYDAMWSGGGGGYPCASWPSRFKINTHGDLETRPMAFLKRDKAGYLA
jgi:hypothetical protein